MADLKISDLSAAASLAGTDVLEIDTGTASQKVTGTQIKTFSNSGFTASRGLVTDGSGVIGVSSVTSTELGYLSGVTSALQTQLNGKSNTGHTHVLSNITDVTATVTEVNYLVGVTSGIQSQLGGKVNTTRSINTNAPLTGGGDLSADRTLSLDITGATSTTVATGDEVLIYDISIPGIRKTTAGSIAALGGGGGGISDAPDSNNYVRTSGSWVNITSLTFTPAAHTQTLSTISDVTSSAAEVNVLDGFTGSTGDLNEIAGISGNDQSLRVFLTNQTVSSTGSQTLSLTHQNSFLYMTNTSTTTWTIPPNSTTSFNVGTEIEFWRSDASVVITEGSGVTLNGHDGTNAVTTTATLGTQHTGCCIKKVATDTWVVFGRFTAS